MTKQTLERGWVECPYGLNGRQRVGRSGLERLEDVRAVEREERGILYVL